MTKNIPVINVQGRTLAEAYENALLQLMDQGIEFETQYDKPGDPKSIDATMNITVSEPWQDPMIHKAFPGGIEDLREYVMELEGAKDDFVKVYDDKEDTRWEYTYAGRFGKWGTVKKRYDKSRIRGFVHPAEEDEESVCLWEGDDINQIEAVVKKLCKQPFTRQAQMITWDPRYDLECYDPPCIQSIWCRILEKDDIWYLNYNVRIRSNDAWGAYFMNSFGITVMVKELIADEIAKRTGKTVKLGRMNWQADSWHIYGKDREQAKQMFFDRVDKTDFEDRVYNFHDQMIQEIYNEAKAGIEKKIKQTKETF